MPEQPEPDDEMAEADAAQRELRQHMVGLRERVGCVTVEEDTAETSAPDF